MITNYADCINNIQKTAKSQGKSMKYLCDLLNKRRGFLSEVRNGKDKLDDNELEIIASALGTTPEHLCEPSSTFKVKTVKFDISRIADSLTVGLEPEADKLTKVFGEDIIDIPDDRIDIVKKIVDMDESTLLKLEKILDMILEEK